MPLNKQNSKMINDLLCVQSMLCWEQNNCCFHRVSDFCNDLAFMEVDFKDCVLVQNELNLKESGLLFQTVTSKAIVVVDQLGFLAFS